MAWNYKKAWYHGSPVQLISVRAGSTITQDRNLARVFSHKPSLLSQDTTRDGERILKHTGNQPDYLYRIAEKVSPEDVCPHHKSSMAPGQEWLTKRALRVELLCPTRLLAGELLSAEELEELKARQAG